MVSTEGPWKRFCRQLCEVPELGLSVDPSRACLDEPFLAGMAAPLARAFDAMDALEKGAIANPDEKRMVGHYWLRAPELAPTPEITGEVEARSRRSRPSPGPSTPARSSRSGPRPSRGSSAIGIGGSALGPMFVPTPSGSPARDKMRPTSSTTPTPTASPASSRALEATLAETLVVVISQERRHPGDPQRHAGRPATPSRAAGLDFARHAVAITGTARSSTRTGRERKAGSARFPMWDWVGGRTSELSRGRPAARGAPGPRHRRPARRRRRLRRRPPACTTPADNPAALLALMWYHATDGKGSKDMVVLPYKDRLLLFSRYLQQLVMESLGQAARPRRASASTRASRSTATRARPTSTPTCSSSATA